MGSGLEILIVIVISLIGGVAVGVQGPMSASMSTQLGALSSSFIIHLGGLIASGLLLLVAGGQRLYQWQVVPRAYLFVGLAGVFLFIVLSYTIPRIGAVTTSALLIAAQLITAVLIDHFGWFGVPQQSIDSTRLLGVALLIVATVLLSR